MREIQHTVTKPVLGDSTPASRLVATGLGGVALYFGSLMLLSAVGGAAKAPFWLGYQVTLLYVGPPFVAFLLIWACNVALRVKRVTVLLGGIALCAVIVVLWIMLFRSFKLVLVDIREFLLSSHGGSSG